MRNLRELKMGISGRKAVDYAAFIITGFAAFTYGEIPEIHRPTLLKRFGDVVMANGIRLTILRQDPFGARYLMPLSGCPAFFDTVLQRQAATARLKKEKIQPNSSLWEPVRTRTKKRPWIL